MRWASPARCLLREPLRLGEVRRRHVPSSVRVAFAYDFACPNCEARNTWFVAPILEPIIEGELIADQGGAKFLRPSFISSARKSKCIECGAIIELQDGAFASC